LNAKRVNVEMIGTLIINVQKGIGPVQGHLDGSRVTLAPLHTENLIACNIGREVSMMLKKESGNAKGIDDVGR